MLAPDDDPAAVRGHGHHVGAQVPGSSHDVHGRATVAFAEGGDRLLELLGRQGLVADGDLGGRAWRGDRGSLQEVGRFSCRLVERRPGPACRSCHVQPAPQAEEARDTHNNQDEHPDRTPFDSAGHRVGREAQDAHDDGEKDEGQGG